MTTTDHEMQDLYERLELLREPFPPEQIGKLPKGGVTLDFVGHAHLTGRLLDIDPLWTWEPFALDDDGLPKFDKDGCLWIRLTVCGVTRIGVGDAGGKTGGNAKKEAIGDALRNAAMRFGAALELWAKADSHGGYERKQQPRREKPAEPTRAANQDALDSLQSICVKHKLKTAEVAKRYADEHDNAVLTKASAEDILEFSQQLVLEAAQDADPLADSVSSPNKDELF